MPEGGALVEVTLRTIQSRLLLRPGPAVNEIILGVLGRAQRLYGVRCAAGSLQLWRSIACFELASGTGRTRCAVPGAKTSPSAASVPFAAGPVRPETPYGPLKPVEMRSAGNLPPWLRPPSLGTSGTSSATLLTLSFAGNRPSRARDRERKGRGPSS